MDRVMRNVNVTRYLHTTINIWVPWRSSGSPRDGHLERTFGKKSGITNTETGRGSLPVFIPRLAEIVVVTGRDKSLK